MRTYLACVVLFAAALPSRGVETGRALHVHPTEGSDSSDGVAQPVKSIARAIRLAQPGDTIHLAAATYYESAEFGRKAGEPGRPITLDGHGAVLEGSEPVLKKDWEQVSPGLYKRQHLLPHMDAAMIQRWFMLWNGSMNHMGRSSKGKRAALKPVAELQPGEWTYVTEEDAFYLKLLPEQDLEAAKIRYPARSSGVAMGGTAAHLVIRDLTCTHVWNDGFNAHGSVRDCRFENIAAIECGDDGFSAHEDCECDIRGFLSRGNSTGIADVNSSITHYEQVQITESKGVDILIQGDGEHRIRDAVIFSATENPLAFSGAPAADAKRLCTLALENVLLLRSGAGGEVRIGKGAALSAQRCSFLGLHVLVDGGEAFFQSCWLGGNPRPRLALRKEARWRGSNNRYEWQQATVEGSIFTPATYADFKRAVYSDTGSVWTDNPVGQAEGSSGVDRDRLKSLGLPLEVPVESSR